MAGKGKEKIKRINRKQNSPSHRNRTRFGVSALVTFSQ